MLSRTFWTRLETQEFIHLYTCTNKQDFILRVGGGEGREGTLNKVLYGEALPRGPTPYHVISTFLTERVPFFGTNDTPFTYLV